MNPLGNTRPAAAVPRLYLAEALTALTPRVDSEMASPPIRSGRSAKRGQQLDGVDWQVVVQLRRQASEQIAENSQHWANEHGRPMSADDRRMMGRSVIGAGACRRSRPSASGMSPQTTSR